MTLVIFLGSLLGSMALGIPIAFALLLVSVALMFHLDLFDAQIVAQNLLNGADSFPLMAVPFFMLAGEIMNAGGLSKRIVNIAMALVGHKRGGLGYVAIIASCLLASLSGSAVADAAALAALLVPMMVLAGHNRARSAGLIAAGVSLRPSFRRASALLSSVWRLGCRSPSCFSPASCRALCSARRWPSPGGLSRVARTSRRPQNARVPKCCVP